MRFDITPLSRGLLVAALGGMTAFATMTSESDPARAVEGGVYGAPLGGTDIRQAYLPAAPGIYGAIAGVGALSPNYRDQTGAISATANPASLYAGIGAAGLLFVYPVHPLDFTIASSIQFAYISEHQSLTVAGKTLTGYGAGFQDSFADLFFASHYIGLMGATPGNNPKLHYGLTGAFGLAAELPIGAYNVANFVNPGKNTFITVPSVAFTYLTGPNLSIGDGTELSFRFFFDTNKRNPASGYQGGNLTDIDYSISERIHDWQVGVAGDYAQQLNGDHNATYGLVAPYGDKYEKIDLGPVIAYDSPELHATFKLKALFPVQHENNYNATTIVFSAATKLY